MTGTRLYAALQQLLADLASQRARFALVGGLAVSARAEPRFTRDVDLAVAADDDTRAEALVHALGQTGYEILALVEQEATARLATVRLSPLSAPASGVVVDLLFASSGIENEIVAAAEPLTLAADLHLPVATTGHLIATKILSCEARRLQDRLDLQALLAVASERDLDQARAALQLIAARGFDRGKPLLDDLDRLLDESGEPEP